MVNVKEKIEISTDYITLGQFIKLANILDSGGMVKVFLQEEGVIVNGEKEQRRGRKLYPGDVVESAELGSFIVTEAK